MSGLTPQQSLDLALDYTALNPGRYLFPISQPRQPTLQILNSILQSINVVRQSMPGVAATTSPAAKFSGLMIVIEMKSLREFQAAFTSSIARLRPTFALMRGRGVAVFRSVLHSCTVFLIRRPPKSILLPLDLPFRFAGFAVGFSFWSLVEPSGRIASALSALFSALSRLAMKQSRVRSAEFGLMLSAKLPSLSCGRDSCAMFRGELTGYIR